ncbi:hypothetical protein AGMMS49593_07780 [Endomicrobiia bacterium]|nr:hypothetical protein AGMMS49593_07780 [Endomicrobiia bacterium]
MIDNVLVTGFLLGVSGVGGEIGNDIMGVLFWVDFGVVEEFVD